KEDGYTAKWGVDATAKPSLSAYTPRHRVPPEVWHRINLKDFGLSCAEEANKRRAGGAGKGALGSESDEP
ncbi:MAG TPA: hypothetical protein VGT00_16250, partial [Methylomirabilota bacterium]|nr:hypothetical protein [Methylomirabilota bacterium]